MKNCILLILIIIGLQSRSSAQTNESKDYGVTILETKKIGNLTSNSSTLFIFKGNTHLINNFLDLRKHIKQAVKNKSKKHNVKFSFDLNSAKSNESDENKIPSKKFDVEDFDTVCEIYLPVSDIKSLDNYDLKKRNQNYNIYLTLKDAATQSVILKLKLSVKSLDIISTQNENIGRVISENIISTSPN